MVDEREAVALVRVLHAVRASAGEARRADASTSEQLRAFLQAQPEGEREVWDLESSPPVGVGLRNGGGSRWIDISALDDATIIALARRGGLALAATAYDALAIVAKSDHSLIDTMAQANKAVHEGGGERLVLLPETREKRR